MELLAFVRDLEDRGLLDRMANNVRIQFGTPAQPLIGATLLPESRRNENSYREMEIRYRTVVANDGTRFSPAQKKRGGRLVGSMLVELGHQDIADEFTGPDYDGWLSVIRNLGQRANPTPEALAGIIGFMENHVVRPLVIKNEVQRWQAIIDAEVVLIGSNGYMGTVAFPNPSGHRVAAGGQWSDDSYDPWDDILAQAQLLYDKGYAVGRIICGSKIASILQRNEKMRQRINGVLRAVGGTLESVGGNVVRAQLNQFFVSETLPELTINDQRYDTGKQSLRFIPDDVFIMIATTGRTVEIDLGAEDGQRILTDTLGYLAVGRAAGQNQPGRVTNLEVFKNKPPRLEAEGWQTSFPVVVEPEGIAVITEID